MTEEEAEPDLKRDGGGGGGGGMRTTSSHLNSLPVPHTSSPTVAMFLEREEREV
jgi:hypothetical protein